MAILKSFIARSLVIVLVLATGARGAPISEQEIKAAYLYNFARFVDWPSPVQQNASVTIGVLGEPRLARVLNRNLADKTLHGKPVRVVSVENAEAAREAQILFIPDHSELSGEVLARVKTAPVLTVGESPDFLKHGGMVAFRLESDTVRFDVNLSAVEAAGLRVSSQMLQFAGVVKR